MDTAAERGWSGLGNGDLIEEAEQEGYEVLITTEKGLERLICIAMAGHACEPAQGGAVAERPANYGGGWIGGDPQDYDREYCVDLAQLSAFLHDTQPVAAESLDLGQDSPTRGYDR